MAEQQTGQKAEETLSKERNEADASRFSPIGGKPSNLIGQQRGQQDQRRPQKRGRRGVQSRGERTRPEFDQRTLSIRRVARVMAGGRRFNFSVSLVAGDRKGKVGVGLGKGADTALAMNKALRSAKKNMIKVLLTKTGSIPHEILSKYSSARVFLMPSQSKGLVAGSAARTVLELAGVKNVSAKVLSGSKNKLNIARAAVKALSMLSPEKKETYPAKSEKTEKGGKNKENEESEKEKEDEKVPAALLGEILSEKSNLFEK